MDSTIDNSNDTDDLLQQLKNLSNEVTTTIIDSKKQSRSQTLVRLMKELCDPANPIPIIEMDGSRVYVEMHHIIHLANNSVEDI